MTRIAFVGLGNMGGPMARNLVRAGHAVTAFDLSADALAQARADGASVAASVADAVADAAFVVTMLPAGQHVERVYLGAEEGPCLLDRVGPDTVLIDCSTIAAATARTVAAAAAARGRAMLDAPVSGGVGGAEAGTLTFMVGGDAAALAQARPLFEAMGRNIFHAGDSGAGQVAKMCNNMLLAVLMTGTAEAIQLGVANGLDPAVLSDIMKQSSGGNWALNVYNPYPGVMDGVPASRGYSGGFLVDLMIKDLGLAMDAAASTGQSTPLGALARSLYVLHKNRGAEGRDDAGGLDFSSIQRLFSGEG
ncbi:MAG: 3-hydroxyisobutyrate dehydrogenase [Pseudomonadales bacterium]|jgi:3-hydroxyisobutyrate dehydrogenase|nr:3-hydroxyisobutyrate dehydrogenase [Pseudomonadales bacterium]